MIFSTGLDFAGVDWVVQMDCPEDADAYIHRVGRTARIGEKGSALLFLCPSERAFLQRLHEKKLSLQQVEQNEEKLQETTPHLQSMLTEDSELK